MPDICPFCGAKHDRFMVWDEAETFFRVKTHAINEVVGQLLSEPKLGLEHAAYRLETDAGQVWIDSPSAFNRDLTPVHAILFTHHHFMGASNQYRRLWNAKISLHDLDARHPLAVKFDIDWRFSDDFVADGIQAYHVGGHTPGFTFYIYREVLFICDYVFLTDDGMCFNPYGPKLETITQGRRIYEIVRHKPLNMVCGYNYVANFTDWFSQFSALLRNK